jgi:hypothetical protein
VDSVLARRGAKADKPKMTLHLIKLCVGAASIEDLADWQATVRRRKAPSGATCVYHTTFQSPKRQDELLMGGSLYWVMKGTILVRQKIVGFDTGSKDNGSPCCLILLDPSLTPVRPVPRRPFQGWRYLTADDAPADLKAGSGEMVAQMPPQMRKKLAELGLL